MRLWSLALLIKLVLACVVPLSNDEAYYWVWGRFPQLSYYDHPAFIGWLFFLARPLEIVRDFFPALEGIVRWPAVLMAHATLLLVLQLIESSTSQRQQKFVLGVLLCSPFFGLGSLIATPDIPFLLFWCLSLVAFKKLLDVPNFQNSALLAAALGLGFCAKYPIVIFVPVGIAYLFWNRRLDVLRPLNVLTALCVGLIFSAPVLLWNADNDWVSFKFQLHHGLQAKALTGEQKLQQFLDYAGGQLAILGPLIFVLGRSRQLAREHHLLLWMGWGPILFFAWTSLRSPVEANWPIAGHLGVLTAAAIVSGRGESKARVLKATLAVWALATSIVLFHATRPDQSLFGIEASRLKTYEFVRFRALIPYAMNSEKSGMPLFASSYQMAGALSFATSRTVPKLAGINRVDFFDFHPIGRPIGHQFEIALENEWPWPSWIAEQGFVEVSNVKLDRFSIVRFQRNP